MVKDTGSVGSLGAKTGGKFPKKTENVPPIKISPWALARLNAQDVSKAAAEARKKSNILQPVLIKGAPREFDGNMYTRPDHSIKAGSEHDLPKLPVKPLSKGSIYNPTNKSTEMLTSLSPLQIEARGAFRPSLTMSNPTGIVASSSESSLDSPDSHPNRVSSSEAKKARRLRGSSFGLPAQLGVALSRSSSDGYEASAGEDSGRFSSRSMHGSVNWSNVLFSSQDERISRLKGPGGSYGHSNSSAI